MAGRPNSLLNAAPPIGPSIMIESGEAIRDGAPIFSASHGCSNPGMRRLETVKPVRPAFGFEPRPVAPSFLELAGPDDPLLVLNSFSKPWAMTGWRVGWLLVPDDLLDSVDRLAGNFTICPPALSQQAAVAASGAYAELDDNVARYAANRAMLLDLLPAIGLDRLAPADGAFYVYADVSRWTDDSLEFADRLLAETGVAVAPGIDFDPVDGGRFIRMCFAGDNDELERGVKVLGEWLAR